MLPETATAARARIVRYYRQATYCYATPLLLLALSFAGWFFGVAGFALALPAAALGLWRTVLGLALARRFRDRPKVDVGYANLLMGGALILAGLLSAAFALAMTSR